MDKLIKDGKKVIALAQGGLEFYPYDKSDDKFTKDGMNYQHIDSGEDTINIDGKSYYHLDQAPDPLIGKVINIPSGINYWPIGYGAPMTVSSPTNGRVDAILKSFENSDKYVCCNGYYYDWNEIIENGGVRHSPLSHLYQAFLSLLRSKKGVTMYAWVD